MEKMSREEKTDFLLSEIKKKMDENGGIIKTSQITELGVDYRRILSWVKDGTLERVKSGYYSFGFKERSEEDLILGLFPDGVLCLESALYYHHYIGTLPLIRTLQNPGLKWIILSFCPTIRSRKY